MCLKRLNMDRITGVRWFSGSSLVGIVQVDDPYDGIKYFIGSPPEAGSETEDAEWIADWGTIFPKPAGDRLFEVML
jgi:hypothetical protein